MRIFKDFAVEVGEFFTAAEALHEVGELVPGDVWAVGSMGEGVRK